MAKALIGRKVGMTQAFTEEGKLLPVTLIEAGPCRVVQKKTADKDGYDAVQLGFGTAKAKHLSKSEQKRFEKNGVEASRILREVRDYPEANIGDNLTVEIFNEVPKVKVTGTSKGKGFQGVVKRYGFRGGRKTHGSHFHRAPGSIGACADPGKVFKGTKLPGHKGAETKTVRNLTVQSVDVENNLLSVIGAVPGPTGGIVIVEVG